MRSSHFFAVFLPILAIIATTISIIYMQQQDVAARRRWVFMGFMLLGVILLAAYFLLV